MLLLLQHARAVNVLAIQTKLDELIRSSNAGNHLIGSHRLENESLEELRAVHRQMAEAKPH
jgi:low affinity Fe/Cu permease